MTLTAESMVLICIYGLICFASIGANMLFIVAVKSNKKLQTAVFMLLANECISDLLFVALSIFNMITLALNGKWLFGNVFCKIQAALIETSYTVSILSLCAVAIQRYILICRVKRNKPSTEWCLRVCCFIWIISIIICSPLFYAYQSYNVIQVTTKSITNVETGQVVNITGFPAEYVRIILAKYDVYRCATRGHIYWYRNAALIYQCIHYTIVYLLPLVLLIFSHTKIMATLRDARKKLSRHMSENENNNTSVDEHTSNEAIKMDSDESHSNTIEMEPNDQPSNKIEMKSSNKQNIKKKDDRKKNSQNMKISRLLIVITVTFFVLWSPYIITRIIIIVNPYLISNLVFSIFQLLLLASTVPNFFITLGVSKEFKTTVKNFFHF